MQGHGGLLEVGQGRHNELIDPTLHVWEWEIPVYLFLGGLTAGLLVLPAVLELLRGDRPLPRVLTWMPFAGLTFLTLGMVALLVDLEYPGHVWRFFLAFEPRSPMSWGSWILLVVYPVGALLALGLMPAEERERLARSPLIPGGLLRTLGGWVDRHRSLVLWMAIAVGVALGAYTGLLLGTLGARPLWSSTLLGPLFLVSGLSTAAAFILLFRPEAEITHRLVRWDAALIGAELLLIALFVLTLMTGSQSQQLAAQGIMGGAWTGVFWGLVIVLGLLAPLVMEVAEARRNLRSTVVAPVLILIGGLSLRWVLMAAGQASSFRWLQ